MIHAGIEKILCISVIKLWTAFPGVNFHTSAATIKHTQHFIAVQNYGVFFRGRSFIEKCSTEKKIDLNSIRLVFVSEWTEWPSYQNFKTRFETLFNGYPEMLVQLWKEAIS